MDEDDALDAGAALGVDAVLDVSDAPWVDFALVSVSAFFAPPDPE